MSKHVDFDRLPEAEQIAQYRANNPPEVRRLLAVLQERVAQYPPES